jgi:hypothetical protein
MKYLYTKGKLTLDYDLTEKDGEYMHTLMVGWKDKLTGMITLFNKRKKADAYQFYELLELVDKRFFKTYEYLDEWGDVIKEFDEVIKADNKVSLQSK